MNMKPKHFLILGIMAIMDCVLIVGMAAFLFNGNPFRDKGNSNKSLNAQATMAISPSEGATTVISPTAIPEWTLALAPNGDMSVSPSITITETPTETPIDIVGLKTQVWQIFQSYLNFLKQRNIDSANSLLWPSVRMDMTACIAKLSEKSCWGLMDAFYNSGSQLKEEDFVNIWADDKQIILSKEPVITKKLSAVDASRSYLFFVYDPEGNIKFLQLSFKGWTATTEDEVRKMMLDTDQDGITDADETCLNQTTDICIRTDPINRDTDGDGYWDSIEEAAGTNPNDPASHL